MDTIVYVLGSVLTRTVVRTSSGYPLPRSGGSIVTWPQLYWAIDPPLPTSDLDWLARPRLHTQGNSPIERPMHGTYSSGSSRCVETRLDIRNHGIDYTYGTDILNNYSIIFISFEEFKTHWTKKPSSQTVGEIMFLLDRKLPTRQ